MSDHNSVNVVREIHDAGRMSADGDPEGYGEPCRVGFRQWWARNHPFDWWSSKRGGQPLPLSDRTLVWELCQRAFRARGDDNR